MEEIGYRTEENIGEVCFRGAGLMDGYFGDPELTSKAIDQEVNHLLRTLRKEKSFYNESNYFFIL